MTEGLAIIVLGITVMSFIFKNIMLHMVSFMAWLVLGFYLFNQTWPAENPYLPEAIMFVCLAMAIVHAVTVLTTLFGKTSIAPTHYEIQERHRQKVLQLTRPRKKKSPDEGLF